MYTYFRGSGKPCSVVGESTCGKTGAGLGAAARLAVAALEADATLGRGAPTELFAEVLALQARAMLATASGAVAGLVSRPGFPLLMLVPLLDHLHKHSPAESSTPCAGSCTTSCKTILLLRQGQVWPSAPGSVAGLQSRPGLPLLMLVPILDHLHRQKPEGSKHRHAMPEFLEVICALQAKAIVPRLPAQLQGWSLASQGFPCSRLCLFWIACT